MGSAALYALSMPVSLPQHRYSPRVGQNTGFPGLRKNLPHRCPIPARNTLRPQEGIPPAGHAGSPSVPAAPADKGNDALLNSKGLTVILRFWLTRTRIWLKNLLPTRVGIRRKNRAFRQARSPFAEFLGEHGGEHGAIHKARAWRAWGHPYIDNRHEKCVSFGPFCE